MPPTLYMWYLSNKMDRIKELQDSGMKACSSNWLNARVDTILRTYPSSLLHSFREYIGTASGPALILGNGPSRRLVNGGSFGIPVFAINRAIGEYPQSDFWCVHDREIFETHEAYLHSIKVLITQSANITVIFKKLVSKTILIDATPDPQNRKDTWLVWNETTLGWTLHLAMLMGYNPIYTLGCELTEGGYVNPKYDAAELARQHLGVRLRMIDMFAHPERWYNGKTEFIDLSGGNMPVTHKDFSNFASKYGTVR